MKIKLVKEIEILSSKFNIEYDKSHNGGSFSFGFGKIIIGTKCIKEDPTYTLSIISHEIMEATLASMGARFENGRLSDNWLFNFNHQTFENAIQIHTALMVKFIA